MAGITLAQAEAKLALWMAADDAVAGGQAYKIDGREMTKADARAISENIDKWNAWVQRLARGTRGARTRFGVPS